MSKTHRRLSRSTGFAADEDRRSGPSIAHVAPATVGAASWRPLPRLRRDDDVGHRMPRDHELRIDLQTLFDGDEPDASADDCGDVWRLIGLDPDALCAGADGLVRLTVV